MAADVLRTIVTLLILSLVMIFIIGIILDKRPIVEQFTTLLVFTSLLFIANIDALFRRSAQNPACMCCVYTILFTMQLVGLLVISIQDERVRLTLWFQIDILLCVITFVAAAYHVILIAQSCNGGTQVMKTSNANDFVAINVKKPTFGTRTSSLNRAKHMRMPGKLQKGMKIGGARNDLAF